MTNLPRLPGPLRSWSLAVFAGGQRTVALSLVLAVALLAGCGKKAGSHTAPLPDLPAAAVRIQNAESKTVAVTEEIVGTVRAQVRATIEAKVSGRIAQMPVVLGQKVTKGERLVRLDAQEIQARRDQAQATLDQAQRDWTRFSTLLAQQTVTRAEFDTADARYRVAQAALAEAETMLGYVEIAAPFNGVVARKHANAGDLAQPGKPLLDIEDPSALQLEADVPEAIASRVERGARLAVRVDAVAGDLTGVVSEIAPGADPGSRTFRVKVDLPQTPGLKAGQFARLVVPVGEGKSLRVPASGVLTRGQMEIVFVVAEQRARLHLVKTGKRFGDEVEILSGLDTGEPIVVEGTAQLQDGQPVMPR